MLTDDQIIKTILTMRDIVTRSSDNDPHQYLRDGRIIIAERLDNALMTYMQRRGGDSYSEWGMSKDVHRDIADAFQLSTTTILDKTQWSELIIEYGTSFAWQRDALGILLDYLPGGRGFRPTDPSGGWPQNIAMREKIDGSFFYPISSSRLYDMSGRDSSNVERVARNANAFGYSVGADWNGISLLSGLYFEHEEDEILARIKFS